MFRIMFRAAFENDVEQQDKQTQVKRSEHRECRSKTKPGGAAARFDDKLEANQRNAGKGLLQHIVNRGDGGARFFHSVVVDVVNPMPMQTNIRQMNATFGCRKWKLNIIQAKE